MASTAYASDCGTCQVENAGTDSEIQIRYLTNRLKRSTENPSDLDVHLRSIWGTFWDSSGIVPPEVVSPLSMAFFFVSLYNCLLRQWPLFVGISL